jgi:hypothetical protein
MLEQKTMNSKLDQLIEAIEFENLTIIEVSNLLNDAFDLSRISESMVRIRKKRQLAQPNTFGSCGINRDANPCGDASEY